VYVWGCVEEGKGTVAIGGGGADGGDGAACGWMKGGGAIRLGSCLGETGVGGGGGRGVDRNAKINNITPKPDTT